MRLPDYKMVQGGNTRVNMSAGAASQVGKAFASMGKDLESAGMQVSGIFEEAEKQHNAGQMADLQLELDQTYSEFQQKMSSNPNNALKWRDDFTKLMGDKRAELEARDMSRNLREQSMNYFKGFEGKRGISVSHQAHTTILSNASQSAEARQNDLWLRGEKDEARALLEENMQRGLIPTAQGEVQMLQWDREDVDDRLKEEYTDDPVAWLEKAEAGNVTGVNGKRLDAHIQKAKSLRSINTMDNVNEVKNNINEGTLYKNEDELEQAMSDRKMDATTKRAMHDYFVNRNVDELKKYNAKPEQQQALISRFTSSLRDYKPNGQPDDMGYAQRLSMLDDINNPAIKKELVAKLDSLRNGKEVKIKNKRDWAEDQISRRQQVYIDRHNANKPKVEDKTLGGHLQDGWINKEANLYPYFNQSEINKIMSAKEKVDGKMMVTQKARLNMFKKLYRNDPSRQGKTQFQKDMAYAITKGGMGTVVSKSFDQKAMDKWQREDQLMHARLGGNKENTMKGFANRDLSEMSYNDLNNMIGSAEVQDDPDTEWDDPIEIKTENTPVTAEDAVFMGDYKKYAETNDLDSDPYYYEHYYDYRGAWEAGFLDKNKDGHLPSKFKKAGHPRTYMSPNGKDFSSRPVKGWTDTRDDTVVGGGEAINELDNEEVRGYNDLPIARPERDIDSLLPAKPQS